MASSSPSLRSACKAICGRVQSSARNGAPECVWVALRLSEPRLPSANRRSPTEHPERGASGTRGGRSRSGRFVRPSLFGATSPGRGMATIASTWRRGCPVAYGDLGRAGSTFRPVQRKGVSNRVSLSLVCFLGVSSVAQRLAVHDEGSPDRVVVRSAYTSTTRDWLLSVYRCLLRSARVEGRLPPQIPSRNMTKLGRRTNTIYNDFSVNKTSLSLPCKSHCGDVYED